LHQVVGGRWLFEVLTTGDVALLPSLGTFGVGDIDRDGQYDQGDYKVVIVQKAALVAGQLSTAAEDNQIGYTCSIFNAELENYTQRHRHYNPDLGRWLQRDPSGYVDGMNLYAYGMSSPMNYGDPMGLEATSDEAYIFHRRVQGAQNRFDAGIITAEELVAQIASYGNQYQASLRAAVRDNMRREVVANINDLHPVNQSINTAKFVYGKFHSASHTGAKLYDDARFAGNNQADSFWQAWRWARYDLLYVKDAIAVVTGEDPVFLNELTREERVCKGAEITSFWGSILLLRKFSPVKINSAPRSAGATPKVSTKGYGNVGGGVTTAENALTQAEKYLGHGCKEISPGVYRSADGARQFRMTNSDLLDPRQGPHVHFEAIGPDGRTIIENSHVTITNP
jgi:RHS repeat-associated protein